MDSLVEIAERSAKSEILRQTFQKRIEDYAASLRNITGTQKDNLCLDINFDF